SITQPAHGSAALNGNQVIYMPASGFFGSDSFTYTVRSSENTSTTAAVNVTVFGPPQAMPDSVSLVQDVPTSIAVLANDSDPSGSPLSLVGVTAAAHGTASLSGGAILYTPSPGYVGSDVLTYTVQNGHNLTASAQVALTVTAFSPQFGISAPAALTMSRN